MVSDDIVFSKQLFNTDVLSQYPGGGATLFLAGVDHGTYETVRLTRRYPPICRPSDRTSIVAKIGASRITGGSPEGYKPVLPARVSRRGLLLCSSLIAIASLALPLKGFTTYLNGSSYSLTLSLSFKISFLSCS